MNVRKITRWLFHCFYKIKYPRFYSNRTFCTLFFVHSSSESSKTLYRFASLNILVVLFFILHIALSYVGISYIVLSVIVLSVIVVIVLLVIILSVIVDIVLSVIILSIIVED